MDEDESTYEVAGLGGAEPNDDGSYFRFTFVMKDGKRLRLAIPAHRLFPLAAISFVAANQARALAQTLASQQVLLSESVEIHPSENIVEIHFRLSGTKTDIPISLNSTGRSGICRTAGCVFGTGIAFPHSPINSGQPH